jgi:hypothetical protein
MISELMYLLCKNWKNSSNCPYLSVLPLHGISSIIFKRAHKNLTFTNYKTHRQENSECVTYYDLSKNCKLLIAQLLNPRQHNATTTTTTLSTTEKINISKGKMKIKFYTKLLLLLLTAAVV